MYALPSDFPHEPPKGYSYEIHPFKRNILSIWTRNHSEFVYNDGADSKCIWGFYDAKKRVYYAPCSCKRIGKTVSLDNTTPFTAMPLLKLALDADDTPASDAILCSTTAQDNMTQIMNASSKTEFVDFCAQQDARNDIQLKVREYCLMLCEALEQDFKKDSIRRANFFNNTDPEYKVKRLQSIESGDCLYKFYIESGRKYHKIIMETDDGQRSVHCFVNMKTGELHKAASFKAPVKEPRFDLRIIKEREFVFEKCDWSGGYLYRNAYYTA